MKLKKYAVLSLTSNNEEWIFDGASSLNEARSIEKEFIDSRAWMPGQVKVVRVTEIKRAARKAKTR